jgi:hypothetical protein
VSEVVYRSEVRIERVKAPYAKRISSRAGAGHFRRRCITRLRPLSRNPVTMRDYIGRRGGMFTDGDLWRRAGGSSNRCIGRTPGGRSSGGGRLEDNVHVIRRADLRLTSRLRRLTPKPPVAPRYLISSTIFHSPSTIRRTRTTAQLAECRQMFALVYCSSKYGLKLDRALL